SKLKAKISGPGVTQMMMHRIIESYEATLPSGPIWQQYIEYMTNLLTGNLGRTVAYQVSNDPTTGGGLGGVSVAGLIGEYLPWTIFIGVSSIILFYTISLLLGSLMAYFEGSIFDTVNSVVAMVSSGLPFFVTGILLIWVFANIFPILPPSKRYSDAIHITPGFSLDFILSAIKHAILPVAATVIGRYGVRALAMRGNSISILGKGYVQVAQLRGLPDRIVALRYVGRNAVLPMYTGMLLSFGWVIGGTVILERVFNYRGIGWLFLEAKEASDYPLLMGIFLVLTLALVIGIYLADLTYGLVDPRITTGEKDAY
ncbi:MAG: ABC transporter permease, partial [Candidatus Nanohaloarchaea archaeon]